MSMWKIIFVECRPVGGQWGSIGTLTQRCTILFKHMPEDGGGGGKHVKVKKQQRQDTMRFRADLHKLILGSIGTPGGHSLKISCHPAILENGYSHFLIKFVQCV